MAFPQHATHWDVMLSAYQFTDLLEAGKGYFVAANTDAVLNIPGRTVDKAITDIFDLAYESQAEEVLQVAEPQVDYGADTDMEALIEELESQMQAAAKELAFEEAARLRDRIKALRKRLLFEK